MKQLNVRVTEEELHGWQEQAKAAGLTLSQWIRGVLGPGSMTRFATVEAAPVPSPPSAAPPAMVPEKPGKKKKPPMCNRCQRIGAPTCGACRTLHGV